MRPPPEMFLLKQGDRLLGKVYLAGLWDMFWYRVRFEPTDAFAELAPLFEASVQALDYGGEGDVVELVEEILARGLVLIRRDDESVIDAFALHLDGENSRLRYLEPSDMQGLDDNPV